MSFSIKFNDKEVQNPVARVLVAGFAIICSIALITTLPFLILLGLIMLIFVTVPLHFILRLCGRRGFYIQEGDDSHTWTTTGALQRR